MTGLLKIEWLKIKNYSAFIVLSIFFVIGVPLACYVTSAFKKNVIDPSDPVGLLSGISLFDFDHAWQTTSYIGGCLLLLPSLLFILLVTNEFAYRTHRQNIIDGISRSDFFQVKVLLAVLIALGCTVVVFFTALGAGLASGSSFAFTKGEALFYFFFKALTYNMVALLISVLVRKTGFAIGLFFVYMWFENFLSGILEASSYYLKVNKKFDIGNMGDYLPMNAADGLLHFPSTSAGDLTKNLQGAPHNYTYVVFGLAIFYLVIFYIWSRNRLLKTDL
jgi:ABC-2 type transport system permease protein